MSSGLLVEASKPNLGLTHAASCSKTKSTTKDRYRSATPGRRESYSSSEAGLSSPGEASLGYTSGAVKTGDSDITLVPDTEIDEQLVTESKIVERTPPLLQEKHQEAVKRRFH